MRRAWNFKDLTGQRFGRVTVLEYVAPDPGRRGAKWLCLCDCGVRFVTDAGALTRGHTRSCGCLRKEIASRNTPYAHKIWRVPVAVNGIVYPSMSDAAKAAGCSPATVFRYLYKGGRYKNITFTKP